ncbi:hypothetical protein PMI06_009649 [Burkholderia sp. BT03]|jgi:hypothetical protein|nr:hypothetical protein PMI06_009649 [Burkholderia sp. BT03]SKC57894.1 hypothetical protein SAMN06266956_0942 [Paraburkholderia hospita]
MDASAGSVWVTRWRAGAARSFPAVVLALPVDESVLGRIGVHGRSRHGMAFRRNSSGAGSNLFRFDRCPQGLFHPDRHSETCALRSYFSLCETIMQRKRK